MKEDPVEQMKRLKGKLEKALVDIRNSLAAGLRNWQYGKDEKKGSLKDIVCYRFREKRHM